MSVLVIDTSVMAKWFLPEPFSDIALALLRTDHEFHAPQLLLLEFDNILCQRFRRRELTDATARSMRDAARQSPLTVHPDSDLHHQAFELALASQCSMYDAVFLSLAQLIDGRMITADRRLVRGIRAGPWSPYLVWIGDFVS